MEAALSPEQRLVYTWLLALLFGIFCSWKLRLNQAFGMALMTIPLWNVVVRLVDYWQRLQDPSTTLQPVLPTGLSLWFSGSILGDLPFVLLGFIAWQSHSNGWLPKPRTLARELATLGPVFSKPESRSVRIGFALFPLFMLVTLVANWIVNGIDTLQTGDESSVFSYMSPYHALALSLAAGFGEELVYRGVLFVGLLRVLPSRTGFWVAYIGQALLFGIAHGGYGTWAHVVMPTLFALVAGLVAYRYGIWAAIVLHVLVDVVAFSAEAVKTPWLIEVVAWLLLANLVWALWVATAWWRQRAQAEIG